MFQAKSRHARNRIVLSVERLETRDCPAAYSIVDLLPPPGGLRRKDPDRAIPYLKKAIEINPKHAMAHHNLGCALRKKRDLAGAIPYLKEAIRLDSKFAQSHFELGNALSDWGNLDGAIAAYREAIRLDRKYTDAHYNLGLALAKNGDPSGAIARFREVIELAPKDASAHNNLAWMLAVGPDGVRDGELAVQHADRACALTGWRNLSYFTTLAVVHAEAGDFDKAVMYQEKALSIAAYEKVIGKIGPKLLDLFERKMPYRDPALAAKRD